MPTDYAPEVGDWYKTAEGMSFEVIAVDEDEGIVEIQYFDGAVEELDTESWYEMDLSHREPPEDWSGPFDDVEPGDLDETDAAMQPHRWTGPLDSLD